MEEAGSCHKSMAGPQGALLSRRQCSVPWAPRLPWHSWKLSHPAASCKPGGVVCGLHLGYQLWLSRGKTGCVQCPVSVERAFQLSPCVQQGAVGHAGQTFPLIDPNSCRFSRPPCAASLPGVEVVGSFWGTECIRLTHLGLYPRMLTLWAPYPNSLLAGHARTPPSLLPQKEGRCCLHGVPSYGARAISPPLSLQHRLCAVLLLAGVNKVEHLPNICSCLLCVLPNRRAGSSTTPGPKCQGL